MIVPHGHRPENGDVGKNETTSRSAHSKGAPNSDKDWLVDVRFAIAIALAFALPALIGAGLYLAATAVLRPS